MYHLRIPLPRFLPSRSWWKVSGSGQCSSESPQETPKIVPEKFQQPPKIMPERVQPRKLTGPRNVRRPLRIEPTNVQGPPEIVPDNVQPRTWIGPRNAQRPLRISPVNLHGSATIETESQRRPSRLGAGLRTQVDALIATWRNSNSGQIRLKLGGFETPVRMGMPSQEVRKSENLAKVTSWLEFDPRVKNLRRESLNNSLQQTLHLPDAAYAHIHDTPGKKNFKTLSCITPDQIQVE